MKLIGRTLLILIAFLSQYYISGSLNVKNILTQISKGDLSKDDVIKFYNKDFDPMLEFHKIFTPCLNHLIDQEMKTESFITNIIQSIKEFFSSSYQEYSIPELGMKVKCETYINKLVSPDFIEKKKIEVLDLKRKLLASAQAGMKFRSKEEMPVEANNKHQKYSLNTNNANGNINNKNNNKFKKNEILIENNGELHVAKFVDVVNKPTSESAIAAANSLINEANEKIEYQVNPEKLFKDILFNNNGPKTNSNNNNNKNLNANINNSICEDKLKKQKKINDLLEKEKDLLQKSLTAKSLEHTKVNDESCKCTEAKNKLETELTQCKKEKTEIQISNTKEKSKDEIVKITESTLTQDESKKELKNKLQEIEKLKEESIKCKQDLEDAKKLAADNKDALQAQKTLSDKLLKENSQKLFEEKDKLAKELKSCSEKVEKMEDFNAKKLHLCYKNLKEKEAEVTKLSENLKTCNEKIAINNKNNNNNNNGLNVNNINLKPNRVSGTVDPNDPRINLNDDVDLKYDQVNPSDNTNANVNTNSDLSELQKKLNTCEENSRKSDSTNLDLNKKLTEAQEKMNILITKINKETQASLEKESEIKKLNEAISLKETLHKNLKETCTKSESTFKSQITKLTEEAKALQTQLSESKKRESETKAKEKSCSEKFASEAAKVQEALNSKKLLETKCNDESKKQSDENSKLKKELNDIGYKHNKTLDDLSSERNLRLKCEDVNKQVFAGAHKKCESRLQKFKEEYDFIVKDVKQLYENLNNTCTSEKKDLNEKIAKSAKDLAACEVNSLKKLNEKKNESEKTQTDLSKEKDDKALNYILKTVCTQKVKSVEDEKSKLEAENKTLKEQKVCPVCPACREKQFAKEIEALTSKVLKLETTNKDLTNSNKSLTDQNALLNKSILDTEKKCKDDLDKAAKDSVSKLDMEKTECKKTVAKFELDKKTLLERNTKLSASEDKCLKDLEALKPPGDAKDLLDKCLKEKETRGKKINELNLSVDKCQKEFKELLNKNKNFENAEKENSKKIEALEKQLLKKSEDAEISRKSQAEKESECADLVFEIKVKLLTQFNDMESMRASMEAKNIAVESFIKKLNSETETDDKTLKNLAKQIDQKIKLTRDINDQIVSAKKKAEDLEKKKSDNFNTLVTNNSKLSEASIKKLSDDIKLGESQIKLSAELIKKLELSAEKQNLAVADINVDIGVVEKRIKQRQEDKNSIQNVLSQYKELLNKQKTLVGENKTLLQKYSKKVEVVLMEAVKTGSLNEKFEKLFAEYQQKLSSIEANAASAYTKFQEEIKLLEAKAGEEKSKCLAELGAFTSSKDAKCFEELKPIVEKINEFNVNVSKSSSSNNINNVNVNLNNNANGDFNIESHLPFNVSELGKVNNNNNNTNLDLNSCLNLISGKIFTENNCALVEPLRAKYNDLCRNNQLLPPNKEVLSFATKPAKDSNKSMLKRLNAKKF